MQNNPIWLFDGVCVLCSSGVQYTLKHEKAPPIQFVAIQSVEGRTLAKAHGVDPDDPTTFLFIDNGQALQKSDAFIALLRHLNGVARMGLLLRFVPKSLRDAVYSHIAQNRYNIFGKTDACMVPEPNQRHRFVL